MQKEREINSNNDKALEIEERINSTLKKLANLCVEPPELAAILLYLYNIKKQSYSNFEQAKALADALLEEIKEKK